MITVNEAPIKEPMYLPNGSIHPVWASFFNQLARVAQGKDSSHVIAAGNLVWDTTIVASGGNGTTTINGPVTSVTSPTLDGNADGGYEFEVIWVQNGSTNLQIFANNDQTATNYVRTQLYGANGVAPVVSYANNSTFDGLGYINAEIMYTGDIVISPSLKFYVTYTGARYGGTATWTGQIHRDAGGALSGPLTRLDFVATVANGIGVNSRFRLWRNT